MFLPMSWLKEYVNIDCNVKEFADKMTMSGSKVEAIEYRGKEIDKVVVCKILTIDRHPDADKLFVTTVDIGKETPIQIVTNAKNISVGDLVPVALEGATLSNNLKIKKGKLRGVLSEGMFCSVEEFGYNKYDYPESPEEGVYIFKENYKPGEDVKKILQIEEEIVEFEITSNRADCFSIIGLAREAAATFKTELKLPNVNFKGNLKENISSEIKINVQNTSLCKRYTSRIVRNVKIAPSPQWLRHRLTCSGIRPINNIVDITNYVMLEMGQPMHAFDLDKIAGKEMTIRNADEGEIITTLDGVERKLDKEMLVISDRDKIIDLAGIMGGENSMITESANNILLEAANFDGINIRQSAKKIGLRTDASTKYEKGIDLNLTKIALDRACLLINLLDCGEVIDDYIDIYPNKLENHSVLYDIQRINKLLGTEIEKGEIIKILESLEIKTNGKIAEIPTFRQDIKNETDIAEEIARLYGYDKIETTISTGTPSVGKKSYGQKIIDLIYNTMISFGFSECLNYSFESPKVFDKLNISKDSKLRDAIRISNPLGEDFSIMRTNTLNGILSSLSHNYSRKNENVFLFEIGKVYLPKSLPLTELPEEKEVLSFGFYGEYDFYYGKGVLEKLFNVLGLSNKIDFITNENISFMHSGRTTSINIINNKELKEIGFFGEIDPEVSQNYNVDDRIYYGVVDIDLLIENSKLDKKYKPLPKFPSMNRDISVIVEENLTSKEIEKIIIKNAGQFFKKLNLFDVYKGIPIEKGYKSMSYNIIFRADEKTLKEEDLIKPMNNIKNELKTKLGAKFREE